MRCRNEKDAESPADAPTDELHGALVGLGFSTKGVYKMNGGQAPPAHPTQTNYNIKAGEPQTRKGN